MPAWGYDRFRHDENITLLRSPNWITLAAAAVVIVAALIVVAVTRTVLRVKRRRRYGEGTANYRG